MLVTRSLDSLKNASQHWIDLCGGVDDGKSFSPIDIIAQCTICLSGLASIRKLLFDCNRKDAKVRSRCVALRQLLDDPALPVISSASVRNSWEHLDERMDELLPSTQNQSIHPIYVHKDDPKPNEITLKRFDPKEISIWFLDQKIPLLECETEIQLIIERIQLAFIRLRSEQHEMYTA